MPYGQDRYHLIIDTIARDITVFAEINQPFAIRLGQVVHGPAQAGLRGEYLKATADRLASPSRRTRIFGVQKGMEPDNVPQRCGGVDYSWHSGAGSSSSVPQLASHASTSSAVACMPVA